MQSSITNGFAVGDCQVIPELGLLTGPTGVHVPNPRILRLLEVLACKAGDVVDRPLMCKTLDHSAANPDRVLTRCISQLRRYLGDDARRPRYLETVPGRGYRLIAPISALSSDRVGDLSSSIVRPNGHAARLVKFFHDLQQRRVCRAIIIYAAVVWLSVQIAETVFPPLGLGDAYAYIATEEDGTEGLPAVVIKGRWYPLLAADPVRLKDLHAMADGIAAESGRTMQLVKFTTRKNIPTEDRHKVGF